MLTNAKDSVKIRIIYAILTISFFILVFKITDAYNECNAIRQDLKQLSGRLDAIKQENNHLRRQIKEISNGDQYTLDALLIKRGLPGEAEQIIK